MSTLEHYFENLLCYGKDVFNDANKNALSAEQQEAVEVCYSYILYTIFGGDEERMRALFYKTEVL